MILHEVSVAKKNAENRGYCKCGDTQSEICRGAGVTLFLLVECITAALKEYQETHKKRNTAEGVIGRQLSR